MYLTICRLLWTGFFEYIFQYFKEIILEENCSFFFEGDYLMGRKRFKIATGAGVCLFSFTCKCIFERGVISFDKDGIHRVRDVSLGIWRPVNTAIAFRIGFAALVWMLPPDAQVRHSLENKSGAACWAWNLAGTNSGGIRYLHGARKSHDYCCGTEEN